MNWRGIAYVMGTLLVVTGVAMLVPALVAFIYDDGDLTALLISAALAAAVGLPLRLRFAGSGTLEQRDAIVIAAFGWIVISAVSALPFILHGAIPSFTDAFFEMMSGYTTTGATILTDIEAVPRGLLFWRSETHLLGGMGFLTLTIIFLPHGVAGLRIFRAESSPGQVITRERFTARNRDAVVYLWVIYLALNLLETGFLHAGGMTLYDSLCHSFGTISTGGFSPKSASIGHYSSAYFDWVVTVFMILGGVNFMLFYHGARREWKVIRINTELRWYLGFLAVFVAMAAWLLWRAGSYGFADSLRFGSFQVVSLLSTTGFATADYELWPAAAQMLLIVACFIGACSGSTTSGIKVVHYEVIWKFMVGAVKKIFFQPLTVLSVRINNIPVDKGVVYLSICYFIANIFMVLLGGFAMTLLDDMDAVTAMSSVIAALMNIGPGFGDVGPTENFAWISASGTWLLSWIMLVGRLDMFTALVILYPSFWRR